MGKQHDESAEPVKPRDGFDNTGTQGKDSLSDDAYTGSSKKNTEAEEGSKKGTGSATKDFHDAKDE